MKRVLSIMAALALFCALTSSAAAEQFDQALGADKLSLVPVNLTLAVDEKTLNEAVERYEAQISLLGSARNLFPNARITSTSLLSELSGDDLYKNIRIISASPDGNKFFIAIGGTTDKGDVLAIWDETGGSIRYLAPIAGLTAKDVYKLILEQLSVINEGFGVTWSPDGRYIALTYIHWAVGYHPNYSALLVDTEKGEIKPLLEFPNGISNKDFYKEYQGTPIRAVFDHDSEFLYYEVANCDKPDVATFYRYELETGETEKLIVTDVRPLKMDPKLWWTEDGLMTMACKIYNEVSGISLYLSGISLQPLGGETKYFYRDEKVTDNWITQHSCLLSVTGRNGILYMTSI